MSIRARVTAVFWAFALVLLRLRQSAVPKVCKLCFLWQ